MEVEAAVPGAAEGASPAPAPEGAQPGAEPQAGGATPAGKTYTGDEVARIVSDRVNQINAKYKGYEGLGKKPEEISAALSKLEQIERATQGQPTSAEEQQMKQLREFIFKAIPELSKLPQLEQIAHTNNDAILNSSIRAGKEEVAALVNKEFGIEDPKAAAMVEDLVARSLSGNPEEAKAFMETGDRGLVRKHFEAVKAQLEPFFQAASARYASSKKQQMGAVPPRMPAGGVPAPGTDLKKLTPEQRVTAAFQKLTEGQG